MQRDIKLCHMEGRMQLNKMKAHAWYGSIMQAKNFRFSLMYTKGLSATGEFHVLREEYNAVGRSSAWRQNLRYANHITTSESRSRSTDSSSRVSDMNS